MIVCNLCGASLHLQGAKCERCSGKGVVTSSPLRLHSPGSAGRDKWANIYTKTPPASPLGQTRRSPMSPTKRMQSPQVVVDVLVPDNGHVSLTRVHGCVLDPKLQLPECGCCGTPIQPGHKLYTAPRSGPHDLPPGSTMCRACFATLFRLGVCNLCHTDVLGDRGEGFGGLHVKGNGVMWHARCFVCSKCATNLAKAEHSVDPDGTTPFCLPCAMKRDDEQEAHPKKTSRYILPGSIRAATPRASTSSVAPFRRDPPPHDPQAFRTAMAVKAKAGVVTQMKELFEAGSR